ncbi:hypothetical protein DL89DRAFT_165643 [Linderina pennispora]|uniref:Uncharacterized protein n=1 Tax=Linderina pennispora TaxID=61395 RepID=A0A1Y1W8N8_9FUNG|nr:uncharacterized protein DL89DRAFT_165643 [Linderina pennispora]ORX69765.1 hypothetical protein DL89DRAFT_165643 [Linderina pennispora]
MVNQKSIDRRLENHRHGMKHVLVYIYKEWLGMQSAAEAVCRLKIWRAKDVGVVWRGGLIASHLLSMSVLTAILLLNTTRFHIRLNHTPLLTRLPPLAGKQIIRLLLVHALHTPSPRITSFQPCPPPFGHGENRTESC